MHTFIIHHSGTLKYKAKRPGRPMRHYYKIEILNEILKKGNFTFDSIHASLVTLEKTIFTIKLTYLSSFDNELNSAEGCQIKAYLQMFFTICYVCKAYSSDVILDRVRQYMGKINFGLSLSSVLIRSLTL